MHSKTRTTSVDNQKKKFKKLQPNETQSLHEIEEKTSNNLNGR